MNEGVKVRLHLSTEDGSLTNVLELGDDGQLVLADGLGDDLSIAYVANLDGATEQLAALLAAWRAAS